MSDSQIDLNKPPYIKGYELYCRFRNGTPDQVKVGPRGGVYALLDGQWRYARKTRAKSRAV